MLEIVDMKSTILDKVVDTPDKVFSVDSIANNIYPLLLQTLKVGLMLWT